ncbi:4Fe-4S dicluster domain-containing protein [Photobacterium sp. SDRW27]|uniref:4Fe-4S dicluster domain-containing protein n=1 Tax=Photobacterium obscurum TaxID=2829490 RepID=UPI002242F607|nr:4Fe-4S double cluster binding domain-containing protein [Photobacterium obscurum]MCW8331397.1 4Fe-4S dicluster domain-containing protein [Photobacterium obscurum]
MKDEKHREAADPSRRNFLKFGGVAAATATVGAAAGAGFVLGRDPDANVGWGRTEAGKDMYFNRESFRVDMSPTMQIVGKPERPEWGDQLFNRMGSLAKSIKAGWNPEEGWENIPDERVRAYYAKYPERWQEMLLSFSARIQHHENIEKYRDRFALAWAHTGAYNRGLNGNFPPKPEGHPDVDDFKWIKSDPVEFKSPAHASELIKKMAFKFGMSLVGITKLDPNFVFKNMMRGMPEWGDEIPAHWKNVIVFGVPMNWDPMYAAVGYSTSKDAYFRAKTAAGLLSAYLGELGYAARPQWPGNDYEIIVPPLAMQAGLGECTRNGILMTPEVGPNIRLAAVITNLDLEPDKPVDLKMKHFCEDCKICADACPSGSISKADKPDAVVRGFRKYEFNQDGCWRFWSQGPTKDAMGCRVCIAVCPYTRKNNWIHALVKETDPRDPTGLTRNALLAMQHNFFYYPEPEAFHGEWTGGHFAGYHQPPEWLRSEKYLNVEKTWEYDGNWEGF